MKSTCATHLGSAFSTPKSCACCLSTHTWEEFHFCSIFKAVLEIKGTRAEIGMFGTLPSCFATGWRMISWVYSEDISASGGLAERVWSFQGLKGHLQICCCKKMLSSENRVLNSAQYRRYLAVFHFSQRNPEFWPLNVVTHWMVWYFTGCLVILSRLKGYMVLFFCHLQPCFFAPHTLKFNTAWDSGRQCFF
jgi:hypothetical protein